jgi:hypothetical protein
MASAIVVLDVKPGTFTKVYVEDRRWSGKSHFDPD